MLSLLLLLPFQFGLLFSLQLGPLFGCYLLVVPLPGFFLCLSYLFPLSQPLFIELSLAGSVLVEAILPC
jgi:hypothetical protein